LTLLFLVAFGANALAEKRTLRLEVDSWIIQKAPVKQAAERFEKDHPDVEVVVKAKDYENFVKSYLLSWNQGNTTVDLGIGGMPLQVAPLIGADHLADLTDVLNGDHAPDKWVGPFLSNARFINKDGEGYYPVLPLIGEVLGLNVNKKFLAEINYLDDNGNPIVPANLAEFEEFVKKLTEVAPGPGLSVDWGWNFINYSYVSGVLALEGDIYGSDPNVLDFESEGARRWLEFNQKMIENGYAASGTITDVNYGRDNFNAGIIPAIFTAHSRFIEAGATLGEENTSIIPLPGADKNGTIVYSHTVYIPRISPSIDLAKQFLKEQVYTDWFQQWSYNNYGKLPVMTSAYDGLDWYQEEARTILKMAENGVTYPKYKGAEQLLDIFKEELHMCLLNKQTPEETLKGLRKKIKDRNVDLTRLDK